MDIDNDPNIPKRPEVTVKSPSEQAVTEAPNTVAVTATEKPKDRIISKPGAEMMQSVVPERTLRVGDTSSSVVRSLTQNLAKASTRSRINKLLGEGMSERTLPSPSTMDKIQESSSNTQYDELVNNILKRSTTSDRIARTSASATLGMYQFQRTTSLAYMSKNLSNALKHTAVAIDTYSLLRAGFTMMERKMNALIINTAAPDAVKRTIYDIVKETLVRSATTAATEYLAKKYSAHIGPTFNKYIKDPALKKASAYMADETTLGGKARKKAETFKSRSISKIKRRAGLNDTDDLTSEALWEYARANIDKGKAAAKNYAKRRGAVGIMADMATGRPINNATMRGIIKLINELQGRDIKGKSGDILDRLTKSGSDLFDKSGIGNITADDIKNALLGTDVRTQGISGLISPSSDPLFSFDNKTTRRARRVAKVKAGRAAQLVRKEASVDSILTRLDSIRNRADDVVSDLTDRFTKTLEPYDIPELKAILEDVKKDPKIIRDPEVIKRVIETIRSTQSYSQAEQLLTELSDNIKNSKVASAIPPHPKLSSVDDLLKRARDSSDYIDKIINEFSGRSAPGNNEDHPGTDQKSGSDDDNSVLTMNGLKASFRNKLDALRNKSEETFSSAMDNIHGRYERVFGAAEDDNTQHTDNQTDRATNRIDQLRETGAAIIDGMAKAFKSFASDNTIGERKSGRRFGGKNADDTYNNGWLEKIYNAINEHGNRHTGILSMINTTLSTTGGVGSSNVNNNGLSLIDRMVISGARAAGAAATTAGSLGIKATALGIKGAMLPLKGASALTRAMLRSRGGTESGDKSWSIAGSALRGMGSVAKYGIDKTIDVGKFGVGKGVDIYGNVIRGGGSAVGGLAKGLGAVGGKIIDPRNIGNVISAAGTLGKLGLNATGLVGKGVGWAADRAIGLAKWAGGKVFRAAKRAIGIRDNSDADMTHGVSRRLDDLIDLMLPVSKYFKRKFKEDYPGAGSWRDIMSKNKERADRLRERISKSGIGSKILSGASGLSALFGLRKSADASDNQDDNQDSGGGIVNTVLGSAAGGAVASRAKQLRSLAGKGIRNTGRVLGKSLKSVGKMGKIGKLATLAAAGMGAYSMMGSSAAASTTDQSSMLSDTDTVNTTTTPSSNGPYVQPEGVNPLTAGLGTGAMVAGTRAAGKLFTKNAAKAAAKTAGKALLKKIPGIGLAVGTGLAASRAMKGDYIGALGEFTSGALSTIPVYGTAASIGIDIWLATRDDPLLEMNVYKALGLRQFDVNDNITNAIYKLVETPVAGGNTNYNGDMVNLICAAFKFPQDKDVQRFVSAWYNTLAKPVAETLRKFASRFGKVNNYDPESYTTRIGRTIFQDIEKDDKTSESLTDIMKTFEKNADANTDPIIKLIMDQGFSVSTYYKWKEKEKKSSEIATSLAASTSTAAITATSDKSDTGGTSLATTGGSTSAATSVTSAANDNKASSGAMSSISNWVSDKATAVADATKIGYESAKAYATDVYDATKSKISGTEMSSGNRFSSAPAPAWNGLGSLSQQFESSKDIKKASMAIGYDSTGGTSYGRYQIAAKTGTFREFMDFLKSEGGENGKRIADMLESTGNPETGGKTGAVPSMWQKIASSDMGLSELEHKFIMKTHYSEQYKKLPKNMQDIIARSRTMQDVLASTSVQHRNYAPGIFIKTFPKDGDLATWITNIYNERKTRFKSSTPEIQASVAKRFDKEAPLALAMLKQDQGESGGTDSNGASVASSSGAGGETSATAGDSGSSTSASTYSAAASGVSATPGSSVGTASASIDTTSASGVGVSASTVGSPSSGGEVAPVASTSSTTIPSIGNQAAPTVNVAAPEMPKEELNALNNTNSQQLEQLILLNSNLTKMLGNTPQPPATVASNTNTSQNTLYTEPKSSTYATNTSSISVAKRG